jgi:hypothetical protein
MNFLKDRLEQIFGIQLDLMYHLYWYQQQQMKRVLRQNQQHHQDFLQYLN